MAVLENGTWYPSKQMDELARQDEFTGLVDEPGQVSADRYHLYISFACPFAHRPYLVIQYLGLEDAISVSSVAAKRFEQGWEFDPSHPDPLFGAANLPEIYLRAKADFSGVVSVPVLWDKQQGTISSNDSAAIALELATHWLPLAKHPVDLVPTGLRDEIMAMNQWLHREVNRKVYQVGFATDQQTYNQESEALFSALAQLDRRLSQSRYLHGEALSLSDLFLLPTLVRFEAVYAVHFKANKKALNSFSHVYRYMLELVQEERVRATIDIDYMKMHYYFSHKHINPYGIVPAGPELSWI